MLKQQIKNHISQVLKTYELEDVAVVVDYPADKKHGDYTTNVALMAAKKAGKIPRELAEEIRLKLTDEDIFEKIEIAGPGFINFWIKDEIFIKNALSNKNLSKVKTDLSGKKLVVEYAHPNTHKAFHIGHLRNITTGESLIRLLEAADATVVRANYQGDVGMHIAKCLYAMLHDEAFDVKSVGTDIKERVDFLGKAYAAGSKAFEENENAQKEIREINKKIYAKDADIRELYETTRQWSLDYFETIYKRVGSRFDRYYFESEIYTSGKETVLRGLDEGIFEKSDGAIIFPGSKYGLHDRVFITSEGNPTYEGKEMGLGPLQFEENHPDYIIHVVGPEQSGYFQVVFEALAQLHPETRDKERHLAYGWVKLKHGKMSSRSGNVVLGEWLINEAKSKIFEILKTNRSEYTKEEEEEIAEKVAIGAVKYSFLKVSTGQEIAFDLEESVSFDGNSGPYLQYTYARTQSVLKKAGTTGDSVSPIGHVSLEIEERELLQLLVRFEEIVEEAAMRYAPNLIANYLFELSQAFNAFYQRHQILKGDSQVQEFRLELTGMTGKTMKQGLYLLGIQAPERM